MRKGQGKGDWNGWTEGKAERSINEINENTLNKLLSGRANMFTGCNKDGYDEKPHLQRCQKNGKICDENGASHKMRKVAVSNCGLPRIQIVKLNRPCLMKSNSMAFFRSSGIILQVIVHWLVGMPEMCILNMLQFNRCYPQHLCLFIWASESNYFYYHSLGILFHLPAALLSFSYSRVCLASVPVLAQRHSHTCNIIIEHRIDGNLHSNYILTQHSRGVAPQSPFFHRTHTEMSASKFKRQTKCQQCHSSKSMARMPYGGERKLHTYTCTLSMHWPAGPYESGR